MLFNSHLPQEATTLTKWLISIPSIAHTKGPSHSSLAIYEGLKDFPYYVQHPEHLFHLEHKQGSKSSVLALVKSPLHVRDTLVLLCTTDTHSPIHYGLRKSLSTQSDALYADLKKAYPDLEDGLYGLGVLESKCATGSMIAVLKEISDHHVKLNLNVLFVCTSDSLESQNGIKECLPFMKKLCAEEELRLRLSLNVRPQLEHAEAGLQLYTGNYGKVEPAFYILGKSAPLNCPFQGFSASLIASELVREIDLNPKLTFALHDKVLTPCFESVRLKEFSHDFSPDGMQLSFSLPLVDFKLADLIEILKDSAARAILRASDLVDQKEALYASLQGKDFQQQSLDAEVVSFSDLVDRARKNYQGDLETFLHTIQKRCADEGLSQQQSAILVIEHLNEIAALPRPSIIVYFNAGFIPVQSLNPSSAEDREIYLLIDNVLHHYEEYSTTRPKLSSFYAPGDANFMRPQNAERDLKIISHECPLQLDPPQEMRVPNITLGLAGSHLCESQEHVTQEMCSYVPQFIMTMVNTLSENLNTFDQMKLSATKTYNLESISAATEAISRQAVQELQTVEQICNNENSFYAQIVRGSIPVPLRHAAHKVSDSTPEICESTAETIVPVTALAETKTPETITAMADADQLPEISPEASIVDQNITSVPEALIDPISIPEELLEETLEPQSTSSLSEPATSEPASEKTMVDSAQEKDASPKSEADTTATATAQDDDDIAETSETATEVVEPVASPETTASASQDLSTKTEASLTLEPLETEKLDTSAAQAPETEQKTASSQTIQHPQAKSFFTFAQKTELPTESGALSMKLDDTTEILPQPEVLASSAPQEKTEPVPEHDLATNVLADLKADTELTNKDDDHKEEKEQVAPEILSQISAPADDEVLHNNASSKKAKKKKGLFRSFFGWPKADDVESTPTTIDELKRDQLIEAERKDQEAKEAKLQAELEALEAEKQQQKTTSTPAETNPAPAPAPSMAPESTPSIQSQLKDIKKAAEQGISPTEVESFNLPERSMPEPLPKKKISRKHTAHQAFNRLTVEIEHRHKEQKSLEQEVSSIVNSSMLSTVESKNLASIDDVHQYPEEKQPLDVAMYAPHLPNEQESHTSPALSASAASASTEQPQEQQEQMAYPETSVQTQSSESLEQISSNAELKLKQDVAQALASGATMPEEKQNDVVIDKEENEATTELSLKNETVEEPQIVHATSAALPEEPKLEITPVVKSSLETVSASEPELVAEPRPAAPAPAEDAETRHKNESETDTHSEQKPADTAVPQTSDLAEHPHNEVENLKAQITQDIHSTDDALKQEDAFLRLATGEFEDDAEHSAPQSSTPAPVKAEQPKPEERTLHPMDLEQAFAALLSDEMDEEHQTSGSAPAPQAPKEEKPQPRREFEEAEMRKNLEAEMNLEDEEEDNRLRPRRRFSLRKAGKRKLGDPESEQLSKKRMALRKAMYGDGNEEAVQFLKNDQQAQNTNTYGHNTYNNTQVKKKHSDAKSSSMRTRPFTSSFSPSDDVSKPSAVSNYGNQRYESSMNSGSSYNSRSTYGNTQSQRSGTSSSSQRSSGNQQSQRRVWNSNNQQSSGSRTASLKSSTRGSSHPKNQNSGNASIRIVRSDPSTFQSTLNQGATAEQLQARVRVPSPIQKPVPKEEVILSNSGMVISKRVDPEQESRNSQQNRRSAAGKQSNARHSAKNNGPIPTTIVVRDKNKH